MFAKAKSLSTVCLSGVFSCDFLIMRACVVRFPVVFTCVHVYWFFFVTFTCVHVWRTFFCDFHVCSCVARFCL